MIDVTREYGFLSPLLMCQEPIVHGYTCGHGGMKRFYKRLKFLSLEDAQHRMPVLTIGSTPVSRLA